MTDRQRTGKYGEELARRHLVAKGYTIEALNYRYRRTEIDIVARMGEALVFVEVKTRRSRHFGGPSGALTYRQRQKLASAASDYCYVHDHEWEIRFDLVAIYLKDRDTYQLEHFEDVFFPGLH